MGVGLNGAPEIPPWVVPAFFGGLVLMGLLFILSYRLSSRKRKRRKSSAKNIAVLAGASVDVHFVDEAKRPTPTGAIFNSGRYRRPQLNEGFEFFSMEVTITPKDSRSEWDPTALAIVPATFVPSDDASVRKYMTGLLSNETCVEGCFSATKKTEVTGAQRLRLVFSIPKGVHAVKLYNCATCFGHVKLPAPIVKRTAPPRGAPVKEPSRRVPSRAAMAHGS
jgi:cation diffusion facilitator CzcD-associated flavoprotein CzcO